MRVTLVVCTYSRSRSALLEGLLRSVLEGTRQPEELLLVVDREPVLEEELRTTWEARGVHVLGSPAGGLSAARNVGWRAATSDWIAFVDDDAVVAPDWLARLADAMASSGRAIVGGAIDPAWRVPRWYTSRLGWVVGCTFDGFPTRPGPVASVIGCNMAVRRELLDRLGGFSDGLGRTGSGALIGSEETELCIRAARSGAGCWYEPGARVWQVVPPDRRRIGYAWRRAVGEGRSKARLAAAHGAVLGRESRYTRDLVAEALWRLTSGLLGRPPGTVRQGAAQLTVLAVTATAYLRERWLLRRG